MPDDSEAVKPLSDEVICADCGWLGPWFESYRILRPNERRAGGERGFYLCCPCWDRLVGAAALEAFR